PKPYDERRFPFAEGRGESARQTRAPAEPRSFAPSAELRGETYRDDDYEREARDFAAPWLEQWARIAPGLLIRKRSPEERPAEAANESLAENRALVVIPCL